MLNVDFKDCNATPNDSGDYYCWLYQCFLYILVPAGTGLLQDQCGTGGRYSAVPTCVIAVLLFQIAYLVGMLCIVLIAPVIYWCRFSIEIEKILDWITFRGIWLLVSLVAYNLSCSSTVNMAAILFWSVSSCIHACWNYCFLQKCLQLKPVTMNSLLVTCW